MNAPRKRGRSLFLGLALTLLLPLCSSCAGDARRSVTFTDVFDTVTEFVAYGATQAEFQAASNALHEELLRLHRLCDIYNPYEGVTNLYAVNARGGLDRFELDPDLIRILSAGKEYYEKTGGKLNIGLGAVLSLWHDAMQAGDRLPEEKDLQNALLHVDLNTLSIEGNTVILTDPDLKLDVGALAKGYAAEAARALLDGYSFSGCSVNLGGNILLRGKKPSGEWTVGVQDPDGGIFTVLCPGERSAVTSGDYQRYMEIDGVRYHHIIDPDTAYPARLYRSVTVLCPDSFSADLLSTSLFCLSVEEGTRLLKECGAEALWITTGGEAIRSEGFSRYEKNA